MKKLTGKGMARLARGCFGAVTTARRSPRDAEIPRYPPFAAGLPAIAPEKILASQTELIARIDDALGFSEEACRRLVLPPIRRYAAFVHLLPASRGHHHQGGGGLFRHGLEVAFATARASAAVIFSNTGTPRERRDEEPRWRLGCCLCGLLHDAGKPLSDVVVSDAAGSLTWNPYAEALHEWAARHRVERYFLRWRDDRHKRHERFSLLAVDAVLPSATRAFLGERGPAVLEAMLEAIAGVAVNRPMSVLTLRADRESVSRDLLRRGRTVDECQAVAPVEDGVFDAARRLVATGTWTVNTRGAEVWRLDCGVFLAWRRLGALHALIERDGIPGVPRDADRLADFLIARGLAVPGPAGRYWTVAPRILAASATTRLTMLRLSRVDLLFPDEPPPPVAAEITGGIATSDGGRRETDRGRAGEGDAAGETDVSAREGAPCRAGKEKSPPDKHAAETRRRNGCDPPATPRHGQAPPARSGNRERIAAELSRTFAAFGEAAPLLQRAVFPLLEGRTRETPLRVVDGRALIPYPEGARMLGAAPKVLSCLARAEALVADPVLPGRKVREVGGDKVIVLVEALSRAVVAALADGDENGARGARKPRSAMAETAAGEGEETASPDADRPAHPPDLQEDASAAMTPPLAFATLKEMIRRGEGRWLVTPVVEENGDLVTDARAFDRIADEHPGIGRHLLRGLSHGAQHSPALRLRDGKLYLKKESD